MGRSSLPIDEETIQQSIGAMITVLRKSQLLSREFIAEHLGVSHEQAKRYESGDTVISAAHLFLIAELLHFKIDVFFDAYYNPEDYYAFEDME